jgi:recombination protein RecR
MAMKLVRHPDTLLRDLIAALEDTRRNVRSCSRCGSVTSAAEDPCRFCVAPGRDGSLLCVVEEPSDINAIEASGAFHGRYHALMGRISPMRGAGPDDIRIKALLGRVRDEGIREVILALSTDVEGDSTASFIADLLRAQSVKVSRLAFGLPAGSGIMYSDPVTLAKAMQGRQQA